MREERQCGAQETEWEENTCKGRAAEVVKKARSPLAQVLDAR